MKTKCYQLEAALIKTQENYSFVFIKAISTPEGAVMVEAYIQHPGSTKVHYEGRWLISEAGMRGIVSEIIMVDKRFIDLGGYYEITEAEYNFMTAPINTVQ